MKYKPNFGIKMWALKQARKELAEKALKDKQAVEKVFQPISPLEQPVTASITLKPIEATAPVPSQGQQLNIVPKTALDLAIDKLREQAKSL